MQRLALAALAAVTLAAPFAARAEIGLRIGLEAPIVFHQSSNTTTAGGVTVTSGGTSTFADSLQPAIDVLISAYPSSLVGFDIELREGFAATGNGYQRQGTSIGPGITLNPPVLPLYLRASLPIHLEPGDARFDLRTAAGLQFSLVVLSIYLEGALDFPLAGNNVTAFNSQQFSLGGGVWFKF